MGRIKIGRWEIDRQDLTDTIRFFFVLLLLINAYYEGMRVTTEIVKYVNTHADYCIYAYPEGFTVKILPARLYYCLYYEGNDYIDWYSKCHDLIDTPPTLRDISNVGVSMHDGGNYSKEINRTNNCVEGCKR